MATIDDKGDLEPYPALLKWLENCLELSGAGEGYSMDIDDLADGTTIAKCLMHIDPNYFTSTWGTKIIPEASASWRLKLSNLKKILKSIQDYYNDSLHLDLSKFPMPEAGKIAEHNNTEDMMRFLQLLLGIAVQCEQKEKYIQGIMGLHESVQHTVMELIQELMNISSPSMVQMEDYKQLDEQYHHTLSELEALKLESDSLKQHNFDYQRKLSEKDGQLEELQNELKALKNQIPKEEFGTPGGVKLQRVNRKLDDIMKEKIKAEYERDEMNEHVSELETQLSELQQKNRDLMADNAELSNLRDTVEELKYLEGKVKNYESVISQYKKKLESMQELKRTFKSLEDKNMLYVQQIVDLESELHKFSTAKEQLDTQKKKINTLENELSKESLKSFELSQELEEKSASVQLLNVEIKDLRKQLELPVLPTVATTPLSSGTDMFKLGMEQTDSESLMEAFTPELKDKMYRLEKENELMKRKITSMENTSDKSQPADSHEAAQLDELRKELAEKSVQVEHLQQSLARRNRDLDQLSDARTTFDQLRAQMKAKDAEIEKLKKYLNKAKKIIESFGEKKSDPAAESAQVQQLSNRLVQRDREVEKLEKTLEQQRADREKEERLILSAWYNLGLQFHQLHSKDRLQAQASFLAHQRQALMRKPAGMNTTNTNTGSSSFTLS